MKRQHINKLISALWYIEKLAREIEDVLNNKSFIFAPIELDLSSAEIAQLKTEISELYSVLEQTKELFGLQPEPIKASRIIDTNVAFIWETIEDTWSHSIEKTFGLINSLDKKDLVDAQLNKILEISDNIKSRVKNNTAR